jgi:hypothetical protein
MTDLTTIRARARRHQEALDEPKWLSTGDLAQRFGVSESTVRAIPADELPWKEFGRGLKHRRRRYRLADVEAYEAVDIRHEGRKSA